MKFATSYFYQIRNFKPWMIPISTAKWPPKWFGTKAFFDKNNVVNGLHCDEFAPGPLCEGLCRGPDNCFFKTGDCDFLKMYDAQLHSINKDDFLKRCENCVNWVKSKVDFEEEPIIVMMVYETPNNPCSEREMIQKWFERNDLECNELTFDKSLKI